MKTFFATFAAILCAAAVIFGVYSHLESVKKDEALSLKAATLGLVVLEKMTQNMEQIGPTEERVEAYRKEVISIRDQINRPGFPKESKREIEYEIKNSVMHMQSLLEVLKEDKLLQKVSDL
jgi:hypothetical protein